ncbi:MAG: hypothetical protein AAF533_07010 [Acidobacteriota bacterium]
MSLTMIVTLLIVALIPIAWYASLVQTVLHASIDELATWTSRSPETLPLPDHVAHAEQRLREELCALGFESRGDIHQDQRFFLAMFAHPGTGDRAIVLSDGTNSELPSIPCFSTFHEEGLWIETFQTVLPSLPVPAPRREAFYFPEVTELAALHRRHRALCSHLAGSPVVMSVPGTELDELNELSEKAVQRRVEAGLLRPVVETGRYRMTLRAALRTTWRLFEPFLTIREQLDGRRNERALAATGFSDEATPTRS